jgi:hypothetical protein
MQQHYSAQKYTHLPLPGHFRSGIKIFGWFVALFLWSTTGLMAQTLHTTAGTPMSSPMYTSGMVASRPGSADLCSEEKFTLTLTNVSAEKDGATAVIGSVILKLPAGITMASIHSIEVSDSWTIYHTDNAAEIRLKAHDQLSNAIPAKNSGKRDNMLTITLSVSLNTARKLTWETLVFSGPQWQSADHSKTADFQLVSLHDGITGHSKVHPSATIHPQLVVTLVSSVAGNSICAGEALTFTAGVGNGAAISRYEFYVDGQLKQQGTSNIFQPLINDGQKVSVTVTTVGGCQASHAGIVTRVQAAPAAVFTANHTFICPGGTATLRISLHGQAPWQIRYKANGKPAQILVQAADVTGKVYSLLVKPAVTTIYELLSITDAGGCSVAGNSRIEVEMARPVAIVKQPESRELCEKDQVEFVVATQGTNVTYQWRRNGIAIPGATSGTYAIATASLSDHHATFDVVISGICGTVTSTPASLTVHPLTAIRIQPENKEICENLPVTLTVEAVGTQLTYQWYKNKVAEENLIKGATSAAYTLKQVKLADAGNYVVLAKGLCGETASVPAKLTVDPKPVFGEFVFRKNGVLLKEPSVDINSSITIELPLAGKELQHLHYTLTGHGKSVPLYPEYNFKTGTLTAQHQFTAAQAGVYLVTASATNHCGTSTTAYGYVAVYHPGSGLVKGSGSVNCPLDTRYLYMTSAGKADYHFEAQYVPGTTEVTGHVEFEHHRGSVHFKSNSLDNSGLIISGNMASLKGKGTINGRGQYAFMLSAIDSPDNSPDKLRMMIWEIQANGTLGKLVFDNQEKRSHGLEVQPDNTISSGSVTIRKPVAAQQFTRIAATTHFESDNPDLLVAHPNPFQDKIAVDVSKLALDNLTLTVLDASGVVVYEKSFSASSVISKVEVDLTGVEAGIYLLQTKKGQDLTTTRLYKF